jgi:hypothetical protein
VGVENGEWKVKSGVESGESEEWQNYVIEIKQAVVRCNLIARGNHVSPLALVTDHASRAIKSFQLLVARGERMAAEIGHG